MEHRFSSCSFCGGEVKNKIVTVDFRWGDDLIIIENVPVGVCKQCGEKYFTAEVSKQMEKLAIKRIEAKKERKVPIMEFKQAV